jgi:hypothetical protein
MGSMSEAVAAAKRKKGGGAPPPAASNGGTAPAVPPTESSSSPLAGLGLPDLSGIGGLGDLMPMLSGLMEKAGPMLQQGMAMAGPMLQQGMEMAKPMIEQGLALAKPLLAQGQPFIEQAVGLVGKLGGGAQLSGLGGMATGLIDQAKKLAGGS